MFSFRLIFFFEKSDRPCDPTDVIVNVALKQGVSEQSKKDQHHSPEVSDLMEARHKELDPDRRRDLSKKLWRALRRQRRKRQEQDLEALVQAGCGHDALRRQLQRQTGIERTMGLRDSQDILRSDQTSICEVFAQFYEDLYCASAGHEVTSNLEQHEDIVTAEEVRKALQKLKAGKTGADDGLVAEMLKTGHEQLVNVIAEFFTHLLQGKLEPKET